MLALSHFDLRPKQNLLPSPVTWPDRSKKDRWFLASYHPAMTSYMAILVSEVKHAKDLDFPAPCSFYAKITISRANLELPPPDGRGYQYQGQ